MGADHTYMLEQMKKYCSYQERCIWDVRNKLKKWNTQEGIIDKIINELVESDFINEERFAKIFAGSKFRLNRWGRNKIIYELNKRKIPEIYIQIGLSEIADDEYLFALKELLSKKVATLKVTDAGKRKQALANYALSKGYSSYMIWDILNKDAVI